MCCKFFCLNCYCCKPSKPERKESVPLDEIKASNDSIFSASKVTRFPLDINANMGRLAELSEYKPKIYHVQNIDELLNKINLEKVERFGDKYKAVRFLLCKNGNLVFGEEGHPDENTPAHSQMVADPAEVECVTAGNAYFNSNHQLCILNHKSGDFRPSFNSLQFVLDALSNCKQVKLAKTIRVEQMDGSACVIKTHRIDSANISLLAANPSNNNESVPSMANAQAARI